MYGQNYINKLKKIVFTIDLLVIMHYYLCETC